MKVCINCHMSLNSDTTICPSCGFEQEEEVSDNVQP